MKQTTTFHIGFLALCAALNVGIGAIVGMLKLPIYLDSTGTVLAAALGGWAYGAAAGIISVLIAAIVIAPTAPAYAGTAIVIALVVSFIVRFKFLRSFPITVIGGIVIGIVAAIVSAPVTTYLYGGVSLAGSDAFTAFFKAMGKTLMESVILGGLATDPVDKLATALIAFMIIRAIQHRAFGRFRNGELFTQK